MNDSLITYDAVYKILILGGVRSGKTSLLSRLTEHTFCSEYLPTIGVDYKVTSIDLNDTYKTHKHIKLQLWDTAGDGRFHTIVQAYYYNAIGAVLMFDLTNEESLNDVVRWYEDLMFTVQPHKFVNVILVGSKADLIGNANNASIEDIRDRARYLASKLECSYIETSAKTNLNVSLVFMSLAHDIFKQSGKYYSSCSETTPMLPIIQEERSVTSCCCLRMWNHLD